MTRPIDLLIVDDHPMMRDGIRLRLEAVPRLRIVAEAGDSASALQAAQRLRPDVALVDISMPDGSGIELVRRLRTHVPSMRVVMLTMHGNPDYEAQSRHAGASAYVLKDQPAERLIREIETIAREAGHGDLEITAGSSSATPREAEVLERLAMGWSTAEIARDLGLSPRTIDEHRSNLIHKFNLRSAVELIAFAVRGEWRRSQHPVAAEPTPAHRRSSLQDQLQTLIEGFAKRTGIRASVTSCASALAQPDTRACKALLGVADRALVRAERRGRATHVRLELSQPKPGQLRLAIHSDDDSFSHAVLRARREEADWLDSVRGPIRELGGFLAVPAGRGAGSALQIDLPGQAPRTP